jgi:hypothetical protein
MLAYAHINVGEAQLGSHRPAEALQSFRDALALHEALDVAYPFEPRFQNDLIGIHCWLVKVHVAMGRSAQALAEVRAAERTFRQVAVSRPEILVELTEGYALLSTAVGTEERLGYADRAMAMLRRAQGATWYDLAELRSHPSFASFRSRPDFQLLMMDFAFPAEPFAAAQ